MANDTVGRDVLYLYGNRYPLKGQPQRRVVSTFPNKIVIGDTSRSDQQNVSEWVISDLTGGMGIENMIEAEHINRFWESEGLWTLDSKGIYLGPLVQTLGTFPASLEIHDIFTRLDRPTAALIWVVTVAPATDEISVYQWNGTSYTKLYGYDPGYERAPEGIAEFSGSGARTIYLYLGAEGYAYSADLEFGVIWTKVTNTYPRCPVILDEKLVCVTRTVARNVQYSTDGLTWTTVRGLTEQRVLSMHSLRDADTREEMIVLVCTDGLYTLDFWTGAVGKVVDWAGEWSSQVGEGALVYRDEMYVPVGPSVLKWSGNTVSSIGLDRDDGVASGLAHVDKLIGLDGVYGLTRERLIHWNGKGWHVLYKTPGTFRTAEHDDYPEIFWRAAMAAGVLSSDSQTRPLFFAEDANSDGASTLQYVTVPAGGLKPIKISGFKYAASGILYTPYFDGGFAEWTKTALSVKLDCRGMSATETITVSYMADGDTEWAALGAANSNGITTLDFLSYLGLTFRKIKFRLVFARGTTNTTTPVLESFVLRYYRAPTTRYAWECTLDLTKDFERRTPDTMIADLETAIATETLGTFASRPGETRYVKITNMAATEATGEGRAGTYRVTVSEMG